MKKSISIFTCLVCLLFGLSSLQAQNVVRDTIYANAGDQIVLRGLFNLVSCPCSGGLCEPITQPGGNWSSPDGGICNPCFDVTITVTTTTLYTHNTPRYTCPPPPPSSGPQPPAGPASPALLKETLVIVEPDCNRYTGTIFFEQCDDEGLYFFIRFDDGRVIDPYFADRIEFTIKDGQRVEFDYVTADFETPCSIAEEAVTLTCIRAVPLSYTPTENCVCDICGVSNPEDLPWVSSLVTPLFSGLDVFYNEATESIIIGERPIAPDVGLRFFDCSGNVICQTSGFDGPPGFCNFHLNDLTLIGSFARPNDSSLCGSDGMNYFSYCNAECNGVSVSPGICAPPNPNQIFTDYPWLTGIVNPANCDDTTIKEYDLGAFSYILVQTSSSIQLYYQDGAFYCQSSPNYDCVDLYNLDDSLIKSEFICNAETGGGNGSGNISEDFPWLDAVLNERCCGDNQAIQYQSGIFSFIFITESLDCNSNYGQLYFEDGTLYCTDAANYDCRTAYNLMGGMVIFDCNGGPIQSEGLQPSTQNLTTPNTSSFTAYPNPVSQVLTVGIPGIENNGTLRLYDLLGKTLDYQPIEKGSSHTTIQINLADFEKGIYLLELQIDGQSEVQKIIKQ